MLKEMVKNLYTHPAWLLNSKISKFCHPSYMVIIHHNFKTLLSLLLLSHPIFSKIYQPSTWFFFGLVIPLLGFHQVCLLFYKKSCDIKEFMAWKLVATVFSVSDETKFDVDNTVNNLIEVNNFKLFVSFRKCNERIVQILLISGILNHAGKTPCDKILKISLF